MPRDFVDIFNSLSNRVITEGYPTQENEHRRFIPHDQFVELGRSIRRAEERAEDILRARNPEADELHIGEAIEDSIESTLVEEYFQNHPPTGLWSFVSSNVTVPVMRMWSTTAEMPQEDQITFVGDGAPEFDPGAQWTVQEPDDVVPFYDEGDAPEAPVLQRRRRSSEYDGPRDTRGRRYYIEHGHRDREDWDNMPIEEGGPDA